MVIVIGDNNFKIIINRSNNGPWYVFKIFLGNGKSGISELNSPENCFQNELTGKYVCHQLRHRFQVVLLTRTPKCLCIAAHRRSDGTIDKEEMRMKSGAGNHRRPKNRTEGGVVLLRQFSQQRLNRD